MQIVKRDNVLHLLTEQRGELAQRFGVQSLALFGSVARDEASSTSDVDLLVEFNRPVGLFGLFALQNHLEALLGCAVDLGLSLIHISEPTRLGMISYAVFCLK